jgi:hypothetical protein
MSRRKEKKRKEKIKRYEQESTSELDLSDDNKSKF